jgi:hypothetical protein
MRKVLTVAALTVIATISLWAAAQFNRLTGSVAGSTLTVDFKLTGLGNETVDVTLDAAANFDCQARSGTITSAHQTVHTTKSFTPHNGTTSGSVSATVSCPGSQTELNVSFTNATVTVRDANGNILIGPTSVPIQ